MANEAKQEQGYMYPNALKVAKFERIFGVTEWTTAQDENCFRTLIMFHGATLAIKNRPGHNMRTYWPNF